MRRFYRFVGNPFQGTGCALCYDRSFSAGAALRILGALGLVAIGGIAKLLQRKRENNKP
jgi:hypothetical protein